MSNVRAADDDRALDQGRQGAQQRDERVPARRLGGKHFGLVRAVCRGTLVDERRAEAGEPVAQQGFVRRGLSQVNEVIAHAALVEDVARLAHAVAIGDAVEFHRGERVVGEGAIVV